MFYNICNRCTNQSQIYIFEYLEIIYFVPGNFKVNLDFRSYNWELQLLKSLNLKNSEMHENLFKKVI